MRWLLERAEELTTEFYLTWGNSKKVKHEIDPFNHMRRLHTYWLTTTVTIINALRTKQIKFPEWSVYFPALGDSTVTFHTWKLLRQLGLLSIFNSKVPRCWRGRVFWLMLLRRTTRLNVLNTTRYSCRQHARTHAEANQAFDHLNKLVITMTQCFRSITPFVTTVWWVIIPVNHVL